MFFLFFYVPFPKAESALANYDEYNNEDNDDNDNDNDDDDDKSDWFSDSGIVIAKKEGCTKKSGEQAKAVKKQKKK